MKIQYSRKRFALYDDMEYEVKESDIEALRKQVLRKCKKRHLALCDKAKDNEQWQEDIKDILSIETDEIAKVELPSKEVLKRRNTKEELIHLLYNDILPSFIAEWTGHFLRKISLLKRSNNDDVDITEKNTAEIGDYGENNDLPNKDWERKNKISVSSCKLLLPDEFADIKFYNNNSYSGHISEKMMEGVGIYMWHNGVRYKGQFEQNQIQGRGLLEWNMDCWYKGDFANGYRHGKGIMVDRKRNYVYVGQWHANQKSYKK